MDYPRFVRRSTRSVPLILSGLVGVVVAHAAAYLLAFPSAGHREAALHESGHGYWHHAVTFGAVVGALRLCLAIGRGVQRARGGRQAEESCSLAGRLTFLCVYQLVLFIGMEVGERFLAGSPLGTLASEPSFLLGVVLQLAVAAALLLVLGGVEHVALQVVRRLQRASAHRRRRVLIPEPPRVLWSRALSPVEPRGPPSPCRA